MITYNELRSTPEYWITRIQLDLYAMIERYMQDHQLSRSELANKLGVSKGYVSQVLNGDFDHRLSKLVELSMAVGMIPQISYISMDKVFSDSNTLTSETRVVDRVEKEVPRQLNSFSNDIKPVFTKLETSFPFNVSNSSLSGVA
ncbi:MAG: helix-turn-helix transcriptional regulator [Bacteroidales bacterium]|nr:helix-turn-helix transcriptional regulator [Bacteroidales bacterium]